MDADHHHAPPKSLKNLLFAMAINGGIVTCELIFDLMIQSMALISDAAHNLSDIAVMGLSDGAEKVARHSADESKTYEYRKVEFIAAFVNSIVLSVVFALIFWEALKRLAVPLEIPGPIMFWVAVVAFEGPGTAPLLLQKISAGNLNLKSAWLHPLQDAPYSLGVIAGTTVKELAFLLSWPWSCARLQAPTIAGSPIS